MTDLKWSSGFRVFNCAATHCFTDGRMLVVHGLFRAWDEAQSIRLVSTAFSDTYGHAPSYVCAQLVPLENIAMLAGMVTRG